MPRQRGGAFGGPFDLLNPAAQGIAGQHLFGHHLDLTTNYGEHVIEVVRDASSQLADGLHFLGLPELIFEVLAVADIFGDDVQVRDSSGCIPRRAATQADGDTLAILSQPLGFEAMAGSSSAKTSGKMSERLGLGEDPPLQIAQQQVGL